MLHKQIGTGFDGFFIPRRKKKITTVGDYHFLIFFFFLKKEEKKLIKVIKTRRNQLDVEPLTLPGRSEPDWRWLHVKRNWIHWKLPKILEFLYLPPVWFSILIVLALNNKQGMNQSSWFWQMVFAFGFFFFCLFYFKSQQRWYATNWNIFHCWLWQTGVQPREELRNAIDLHRVGGHFKGIAAALFPLRVRKHGKHNSNWKIQSKKRKKKNKTN